MAGIHVEKHKSNIAEKENMESLEDRLSSEEYSEDDSDDSGSGEGAIEGTSEKKSGMAGVISRILSKDTSNSKRTFLAKGKTNREITDDITERRRKREESGAPNSTTDSSKDDKEEKDVSIQEQKLKEEKRKLWENMARKNATDMDTVKETKLRKIATQGMVQLFQSVHDHQKMMGDKIASVGPSEWRKDKVKGEFTTGKFLDVLKSKSKSGPQVSEKKRDADEGRWKILQDDFMMGASMKDWDKEDDDDDDNDNEEEPMDDDDDFSD